MGRAQVILGGGTAGSGSGSGSAGMDRALAKQAEKEVEGHERSGC